LPGGKRRVASEGKVVHSVTLDRGENLERSRGFKSQARYIALPTIDDVVFCYWRRAA
jgi:hypothetical protein